MADLYRESGVNIDAGNESVRRIKRLVRETYNPQVLGDLGSFGGLFAFPAREYRDPVLVSSTDGVGTKLKVAFALAKYDTVGYDLVNHCVNDILVQGAKPLFFLDYIGAGTVEPEMIEAIVSGLARGCRENGCVLIGGETAEMPGIYSAGEFDLAGTIIGVVERDELVTGSAIQAGDLLFGLPSTGLHTNGYSLARKICFEMEGLQPTDIPSGFKQSIGLELLTPHRSYFNVLYPLVGDKLLKGMAHLTGGGFIDNIPRILPKGCGVEIQKGSWPVLPIFQFLQEQGSVSELEMHRVFNMGIGMIAVIAPENEAIFKAAVPEALAIGRVIQGDQEVVLR